MSPRPPKRPDIQPFARECIASGRYRFSIHVLERMRERSALASDLRRIIMGGRREPGRDRYDNPPGRWSYSFRGVTLDGRDLRVIVVEVSPNLVFVTVVEVNNE